MAKGAAEDAGKMLSLAEHHTTSNKIGVLLPRKERIIRLCRAVSPQPARNLSCSVQTYGKAASAWCEQCGQLHRALLSEGPCLVECAAVSVLCFVSEVWWNTGACVSRGDARNMSAISRHPVHMWYSRWAWIHGVRVQWGSKLVWGEQVTSMTE